MTEQAMRDAPCGECGMPCSPDEYHPFGACLMFKACHNSTTVRANLAAIRAAPPAQSAPETTDGYVEAFYKIAEVLGIGAKPESPMVVFETVMLPMIEKLARTAAQGSETGRIAGLEEAALYHERIQKASAPGYDNQHEHYAREMRALKAFPQDKEKAISAGDAKS